MMRKLYSEIPTLSKTKLQDYTLKDKARIFVDAAFSGEDPLVEIAREGLRRDLPEEQQLGYVRTITKRIRLKDKFDIGFGVCPTGIALKTLNEAVTKQNEEMPEKIFVFDE